MKKWTDKEKKFLEINYPKKGKLWCMKKLNRSESSIRQKTFILGLKANYNSNFFKKWQNRARKSKIGKKRPIHSSIMKDKAKKGLLWQQNKIWTDKDKKLRSKIIKNYFKKFGHPKGMLGKHHSENVKKEMSRNRKNKKLNLSKKQRQAMSDRASKMMIERIKNKGNIYSRANVGWYKIKNRKFYFRSGWEVVYARYLEWLKDNNKISEWEYEPKTFWFEKIKRGIRSYTPDFKIYNWTGSSEYHEVKGFMDKKSKTKIKRMTKYYPEILLIVIDKCKYEPIKDLEKMFPKAIKFSKTKK